MAAVLYVLTERGTRAEADEARALFGGLGLRLLTGVAWAHPPGQVINGDVVVIGAGASTIEQDASGSVKRYASLDAARSALQRTMAAQSAPEAPEEPQQEEPAAEAPKEPSPPDAPPDAIEGMSRVEMIQHAAARWPGRERWANMSSDDLAEKIRELEAGD